MASIYLFFLKVLKKSVNLIIFVFTHCVIFIYILKSCWREQHHYVRKRMFSVRHILHGRRHLIVSTHSRMETKWCSPCATLLHCYANPMTNISASWIPKSAQNIISSVDIRSHVKLILMEWLRVYVGSRILPSRSGLIPAFCACVGFTPFCFWGTRNKELWTKRQVSVRMRDMFHWPLAVPSLSMSAADCSCCCMSKVKRLSSWCVNETDSHTHTYKPFLRCFPLVGQHQLQSVFPHQVVIFAPYLNYVLNTISF